MPGKTLCRGVRRVLGCGSARHETRAPQWWPVQRGRARHPCQLVCPSQATRGGPGAANRMHGLLIGKPSVETCSLWLWSVRETEAWRAPGGHLLKPLPFWLHPLQSLVARSQHDTA